MRVSESINAQERSAKVIALANGNRPCMKIDFKDHKPSSVYVKVVSTWEPTMPKYHTSGSKLPSKKHCTILNATRGIWVLDFRRKDDYIEFDASFMNTKTKKESNFNGMRIEVDASNETSILVPSTMEDAHTELIAETFTNSGPLEKALKVGIGRVVSESPDLFDWGQGV